MKYLLMTLLMLSVTSNAEILDFECTFGEIGDEELSRDNHSLDMTNKTWERTEKGQTEIFDDVVVSSNSISVTGEDTVFGIRTRSAYLISRVDLSYSVTYETFFEFRGGWQTPRKYVGQCKIIDASSVERAF